MRSKVWLVVIVVEFGSLFGLAARADTYTYDTLGRLASVTYTAGGSVTYTYDAAGNRTVVVKTP